MDELATAEETPSQIVHSTDVTWQGRELLVDVLRDWVQETWQQDEFVRLMVIEALFSGGWRNRDTWKRFELRDETAVAGIKFRALKRLRELALRRDPSGELLPALSESTAEGTSAHDFDVAEVWRAGRVSCPARYWLARRLSGNLQDGPAEFVRLPPGRDGLRVVPGQPGRPRRSLRCTARTVPRAHAGLDPCSTCVRARSLGSHSAAGPRRRD